MRGVTHSSEVLGELLACSRVDFLAERVTELWGARMGDRADAVALGRFELDHVLGRGSYGVVFAAHDLELGRDVALKVFGAEAKQDALREAQVLARVQHPNVVALHDVGHHNEFYYLVMALIDGWTMTERMRMGLDWRTIVELFVQVGGGLAAVHRASIVHGDVKPGNMLVGRDGQAYLTDFGFAQTLVPDESTPSTKPRGTRQYMAPECFGGGEIGSHSDQFSFCVALWEALFGERPEACDFRTGEPAVCDAGRGQLERMIRRGLSMRPRDRFPDMAELLDALMAVNHSPERSERPLR
jgi:serine/threonine protein kinase